MEQEDKKRIDFFLRQLQTDKTISLQNRKCVKDFYNYCRGRNLPIGWQKILLMKMIAWTRAIKKDLLKATKEDIQKAVYSITENPEYSPYTMKKNKRPMSVLQTHNR